jgi:hypothetical protein
VGSGLVMRASPPGYLTGADYSTSERLAAESLPRSRATSYLTFCPSLSELRPALSKALMWTNIASIAGLDESVTFLGIEPFDSSGSHFGLLDTGSGYYSSDLLKPEFQGRR